jgi:antitoxin CptB
MTEPDHPTPGASPNKDPGSSPYRDSDARRRRLLFRATHRGTFENDLMIGGFVRAHVATLTEPDLDALESVMQMPDTDLADWLTGRVPIPPEEEMPMLRRMRDFLAR